MSRLECTGVIGVVCCLGLGAVTAIRAEQVVLVVDNAPEDGLVLMPVDLASAARRCGVHPSSRASMSSQPAAMSPSLSLPRLATTRCRGPCPVRTVSHSVQYS